MNEINVYIGGQIRKYRKANSMTLQQLADVIHKSRATVCKYENGEISIDIATLYEISQALQVSFGQLTSYQPTLPPSPPPTVGTLQRSPFFQAKRLYFYFYDGRYHRLKDGVIDIHEHAERPGTYVASFTLCSVSGNGCSNESLLYRARCLQRYADPVYLFQPAQSAGGRPAVYFQSAGDAGLYRWPSLRHFQRGPDALCLPLSGDAESTGTGRESASAAVVLQTGDPAMGAAEYAADRQPQRRGFRVFVIEEKKKKGEKDVSVLLLFIFRYCLFPLGDVHLGQRICLRGDTQGFIINMGVDLRGIQVVMSQNLLDRPDVHAVLQHQGRCRVA